jgi:dUTP pyrophosphatase
METIKIQLCGGIIPTKAHQNDACFDLYVPKRTVIRVGRQIIPLDFKMQLTTQWCAHIRSRSGFSSKGLTAYLSCDTNYEHPIRIDADVITGIVDSGYIGIVGVIVNCRGAVIDIPEGSVEYFQTMTRQGSEWDRTVVIKEGERIAQMAILPVPEMEFEEVERVDDSERGEGGFGSTNKEKGGKS